MPRPAISPKTVTNTTDTGWIYVRDIAAASLGANDVNAGYFGTHQLCWNYYVQLQVKASAGTVLIEVLGPAGEWVTHTSTADPTANAIVDISSGPHEAYENIRVQFTGTSNTNTLGILARSMA